MCQLKPSKEQPSKWGRCASDLTRDTPMKGKGRGRSRLEGLQTVQGLTPGKGEGEGGIGQEAPQTAAHFGASFGRIKESPRPQVSLRRGPWEDIPWLYYFCCAQYLAKKIRGKRGLGMIATAGLKVLLTEGF